jgi:hypothetical protein
MNLESTIGPGYLSLIYYNSRDKNRFLQKYMVERLNLRLP